ncbi:MAG: sulfatase-like hydrolase/transferase [Acidobacteria bacterium]|nr:sulfatase-like hydrolase/transferase [Acidobacteriota bacterium]
MLALCGCRPGDRRNEAPAPASAEGSRDVVLITIDTLRADATGFSGNPKAKTPALDALAREGAVFSFAHAHNVVTLPSHTNILTGLLPYTHGVRDNAGSTLSGNVPTLATRLAAAGFQTGAFVAAFPLDHRFGLARGFGAYDDAYPRGADPLAFRMPERPGTEVVASALAWWTAKAGSRRFLWVHVFEPHAPYAPPPPLDEEFRSDPYLGEVAAADAALAPLLASLPKTTTVIVTADHGESLGEHGEATHGLFCYEATLRVPLVVKSPGVAPRVDTAPAAHIDIAPTVLEAMGLPKDPALPGRSLLSPASSNEAARPAYFESLSANLNRGWAPLTGIVSSGFKYVDLPVRELYDLAGDPRELTNLAARDDTKLRDLARKLPPEARAPASRSAPSAEEAARLRALGYMASTAKAKDSYGETDDPKNLVSVDASIHEVIDLYQRGLGREAIGRAEALVKDHPGLGIAAEHLAFLYQSAGRPADAARVLGDAIARGAGSEAIAVRLGLALAEAGRAKEAVRVLAPLEASADPATRNAYGIVLADAGDLAKAISVFEGILAKEGEDPETLANLGIALLRARRPAEARTRLEAATRLAPRSLMAWNGLGAAAHALHDVDGALAAWARVLALDPGNLDTLYNVGTTAARNGRNEEARAALTRFVETADPRLQAREIAEAKGLLRRPAS